MAGVRLSVILDIFPSVKMGIWADVVDMEGWTVTFAVVADVKFMASYASGLLILSTLVRMSAIWQCCVMLLPNRRVRASTSPIIVLDRWMMEKW